MSKKTIKFNFSNTSRPVHRPVIYVATNSYTRQYVNAKVGNKY